MSPSPVPTLSDGVVTLRAHQDGDIDAVLEQGTDPLSVRWTRVPVPYGRDDAKRFVRQAMPGGWATDQEWAFAIEAPGPDGRPRYAGTVSLRPEEQSGGPGRAEIAYGAHPWARGTGHVVRALRLLLDWGFSPLADGGRDLQTVIWWAEKGNWASRKTAWRLGFSCDTVLRDWLTERDGLVDTWVGTLGRDDRREPTETWLEAPTIHGNGVILRHHRDNDAARIIEACRDERSAYWLGTLPQPYTEAHGEQYLFNRTDLMARGLALHWVVADPSTGLLLGTVSLTGLGSEAGAEVGYWAHPEARGRGVVTEAVRLAARHAFIAAEDGGLGLRRLRLVCAVDNASSRHVAEANGFREAGTEREATTCRDGRHDAVIYDLLAGDLS